MSENDIVARLRNRASITRRIDWNTTPDVEAMLAAADEIERLRMEIQRERTAYELAIATIAGSPPPHPSPRLSGGQETTT